MRFLQLFSIFIFLTLGNATAQEKISNSSKDITFTSDNLEVDEKNNIMIATGNVIIINKNRKLTAKKVTYNQNTDEAIAIGDVVITEEDGSFFETNKATLTNEFKSIVAIPLYGKLADKSSIKAKSFKRNDKGESFFDEGVYTACNCNIKEGETPIWQLQSNNIKHDPISKTIYHKHVKMKIFSIPIYYLPYISHPDWTVKRRTGLLTPVYGYSTRNRFHAKIPYYYAPENDPTWDMTLTSHQFGKTGHADNLNFRKKYENSSIETNLIKGNLDTYSKDGDDVFGMTFFLDATIGNQWDVTAEGKYSDQDTFMRRYGFDSNSSYKSFVELEKVKQNSISTIEMFNIENLDEGKNSNNEPVLAPGISHHIFDSNKDYNYDIKINAHSVYNDEYYDIKRWSASGSFNKSKEFSNILFEAEANLGLDLYSIQGRPTSDTDDNKYIDRPSAGLSIAASKQYLTNYESFGLILEPKIQLSSMFSPDRTDEIPNRDSSEYRLDPTNLFLTNQYQGRDNIQNNQRINTGLTSSIISDNFGDLNFFIGQSQKIGGTEKNIKTQNQNRQSHIINSIDWNPSSLANFSWLSLYDHHDFKSDMSNFTFSGSTNGWSYGTNHSSIKGDFLSTDSDREEISFAVSKSFSNLTTSYSTTYDLNNDKTDKISESIGLEYTGTGYMFQNCLTILFEYKNTSGDADRDLLPEDSVYITFNFRNLGDYSYQPKALTTIANKNMR